MGPETRAEKPPRESLQIFTLKSLFDCEIFRALGWHSPGSKRAPPPAVARGVALKRVRQDDAHCPPGRSPTLPDLPRGTRGLAPLRESADDGVARRPGPLGTLTPKAHLTFGCSLASWPCVYPNGVSWSLGRNLYQPVGWVWNLQVQNSVLTAIELERQI